MVGADTGEAEQKEKVFAVLALVGKKRQAAVMLTLSCFSCSALVVCAFPNLPFWNNACS